MAALALPFLRLQAQTSTSPVIVGQVGPFTGIPVPDARQLGLGISAALADANASGGIHGRPLNLVSFDDGYTPDGFVAALSEVRKRKIAAILAPVGSPAIKRTLDERLLDAGDLLILNAIPGAEALRNPGHRMLFHVRAGDRKQIERILAHAHTLGVTRLGVLHQDIPMGESGWAICREAAAKLPGMQLQGAQSTTGAAALAAAVGRLSVGTIQAVLIVGSPPFSGLGVAVLRAAGFSAFVYAMSYVTPEGLIKAAGKAAHGVMIAQTFPNAAGERTPLQRQFQSSMAKVNKSGEALSQFHFEGYVTARLFIEAALRARDTSASGLAAALQALGRFDLGGMHFDFRSSNAGGAFVDFSVLDHRGRLTF
ncbi:ABC transporter substrate-binding protein [Rhizobacter sp. AJA081-3]|uniref:ABC transporter substrate-binding protein n=1 Tax=Rhizobacter sp. AJA081-3 TaxID=2753607 RepID=UPI001ADF4529|nr:ABC transporter substrate-binding protein [Rhizobacter sp. AJA081-3]QTN25721.1 ABC transporter substrate-binding protein [Rhizobacter sp. AJA081-3]